MRSVISSTLGDAGLLRRRHRLDEDTLQAALEGGSVDKAAENSATHRRRHEPDKPRIRCSRRC